MPFGWLLKRTKRADDGHDTASASSQTPASGPTTSTALRTGLLRPPPGPPPSYQPGSNANGQQPPPPQHDWTSVPDTSLLPPPPSLGHEKSPTSNAPGQEAERAREWCRRHPFLSPRVLTAAEQEVIRAGDVGLRRPREYIGDLFPLSTRDKRPTIWRGRTWTGCRDACLISTFPIYSALVDSYQLLNSEFTQVTTVPKKVIYFEVRLLGLGRNEESSLALGFCAEPYPTWRLPGWERGSLGVHGDDGRRFVNDSYGGKDFTRPFCVGETVGLGMRFWGRAADQPPAYGGSAAVASTLKVDVFFTRNGNLDGEWDLHEVLDSQDLGVEGLDGKMDLYAAVGVFGGVDFEVVFPERQWLYRPN